MRLLAEVGQVLDPLQVDASLQRLAEVLARAMGDFCVVFVVDAEGRLARAGGAARDAADAALVARARHLPMPMPPAHPAVRCFDEARPVRVELTPPALEGLARVEVEAEIYRAAAPRHGLAVPLCRGGRCLGVLALSARARSSDERDGQILAGIAARTARLLELERARAADQRALRAREDALRAVAHDLRTPLGVVTLQADRLRMGAVLDEVAQVRAGEVLRRASQRMVRLVDDLLEASLLAEGRVPLEASEVAPGELVEEAALLHAASFAAKALELRVEVSERLPPVRADRARVLRVLDNLLANAAKFTARGHVTLAARGDAGAVVLSVTDTGVGLAPEDHARVFEPFWQGLAHRRGGVGLGLALARAIVEAHGGRLSVESEPGVGSTFAFTLPVAAPSPRGAGALTD